LALIAVTTASSTSFSRFTSPPRTSLAALGAEVVVGVIGQDELESVLLDLRRACPKLLGGAANVCDNLRRVRRRPQA
jgi:hypothetical protein